MKTLVIFALAMFLVPLLQERPVQNDDARLKAINEEIEKTTPEGKEIIERAKKMLPEVHGKLSTLPLEEAVEKYTKEKNWTPAGWAAFKEPSLAGWQIRLFFQMDTREYSTALWYYDPTAVRLYAVEKTNAVVFWSGPTPR
jgi:hypothetical protein